MNCCCLPEPDQPDNIYLSQFSTQHAPSRPSHSKPKFSFRNTLASSNVLSHSSLSSARRNTQEVDNLEREYQMLKEEERIASDF